MTLNPTRSRLELRRAGCKPRLSGGVRLPAVVFLLAALFVSPRMIEVGEPERARRAEESAPVSPGTQHEAPAETDTASSPLELFFPARLPSESVVVPEPVWTRLAFGTVDALSGDAYCSSLAQPPRRT